MKGFGYLISSLSVVLLMIPAMKTAREDPLLLFCLVAGVALSILGMFIRWRVHRRTERKIAHADAKVEAALEGGAGVVTERGNRTRAPHFPRSCRS